MSTREAAAARERPLPKPIADCREEDLTNHHALVYGCARMWYRAPTDSAEFQWHWSRRAWWKAMWYPHRGRPSDAGAWGVYGGSDGVTGPGDAELTHFLPLPPEPDGIVPLAPQDTPTLDHLRRLRKSGQGPAA